MQGDHRCRHLVAGGISVEAAVDRATVVEQRLEPKWVGPGAGRRKAAAMGMEGEATDGIDSRFAKYDRGGGAQIDGQELGANRKTAQFFLRAGRQTAPGQRGGAAQFSAHRKVFLSQ